MKNSKCIAVGDRVTFFFFVEGDFISGVVEHIPATNRGCWIIKDDKDAIHYIQTFASVRLDSKKGE